MEITKLSKRSIEQNTFEERRFLVLVAFDWALDRNNYVKHAKNSLAYHGMTKHWSDHLQKCHERARSATFWSDQMNWTTNFRKVHLIILSNHLVESNVWKTRNFHLATTTWQFFDLITCKNVMNGAVQPLFEAIKWAERWIFEKCMRSTICTNVMFTYARR